MDKSKFWPIGIALVLVFMIVNTIIFIFYLQEVNFDLVTDNYYQEGLVYQKRIDRINNSNALSEKVQVKIGPEKTLLIDFPAEIIPEQISGKVIFFRPDSRSLDDSVEVDADSNGIQAIDLNGYRKGNWKIQLFWNNDSTYFYDEKSININ